MIKVLFVCHGNICRSPMAEFILKDMVQKRGIAERFYIASAATSGEEVGNPVYPPAVRKLREHEYDSELMRLYVVGGGGCMIRNFGEYDAERVTICEDIRATAKGYEQLAAEKMRRKGGIV